MSDSSDFERMLRINVRMQERMTEHFRAHESLANGVLKVQGENKCLRGRRELFGVADCRRHRLGWASILMMRDPAIDEVERRHSPSDSRHPGRIQKCRHLLRKFGRVLNSAHGNGPAILDKDAVGMEWDPSRHPSVVERENVAGFRELDVGEKVDEPRCDERNAVQRWSVQIPRLGGHCHLARFPFSRTIRSPGVQLSAAAS